MRAKKIIQIEPLGTDVVLPAIVLGYEVTEYQAALVKALPERTPPWLWLLAQQAGGMCMRYPSLFGVVLRLEANHDQGEDMPSLVRGLKAMAEDPDMALLRREYPILESLVSSHGEDYSASELERLSQFIGRYLRVPPAVGGFEAFIRLASCELLAWFETWAMLESKLPERGPREIYALDDGITYIDESNIGELELSDRERLSATHLDVLCSFAAAAGVSREPTAFLLWENSD